MRQPDLFFDPRRLFEELCSLETLERGFKAVKKNKGSPGIDGITIKDFESRLQEELSQLKEELESWTYKPAPVRRVEIPKPGTTEKRKLGVPQVRDRTVQAAIKWLLEPILDPLFSNSSYGFRPGRSQKQAVQKAQEIAANGKEFVVDIDLSKFFDRVQHDRLIARLSQVIPDKRILRLIGSTLRSGVMENGLISPTNEGTTQGSPLSPLLSNFVLDELDKELERRGFEFCRFADDCNIFVRTRKAAERAMENITRFIEGKLRLIVNQQKSKVARSNYVKFLGMTIVAGTIAISNISINRAMAKVKDLTPRGTNLTVETAIDDFNKWYVGWSNYFNMTQYPSQLRKIEAHYRRRIRSRLVDQQKSKRNLFKRALECHVPRSLAAKQIFSNKRRWALSHTRTVEKIYSNNWFEGRGMKITSNKQLKHWFEIGRWIKLS
jgi:RNA-directed DNA polymerase